MVRVENFLQSFGLNDTEVKLYLGLLERGPSSVQEIAKHLSMKRTTAHVNVETLIQTGLITQTQHGARRQLVAEPPERLISIIDQKKWEIKRLENDLPNVVKAIQKNIPGFEQNTEVEVKYYEGRKNVKLIYHDALKAKEFRAYVHCQKLTEFFPENIGLFLEAHQKREDMQIWEIMEDSIDSRSYAAQMPKQRYHYKFTPKEINLSVIDYMMYDGKVAIVNLEGDSTGLVISNLNYYNNAKAIFSLMWRMLPDPN